MTTNPQFPCRELSERLLPFIRRQDEPHSMKQLIARFATSKTLMWGAIGLLMGNDSIKVEVINGTKYYVAAVEGVRTPARMTANMTSVYKMPKAMAYQMERVAEIRKIESKFD